VQELERRAVEERESLKREKESIDRATSQFRKDEQEHQQQLRLRHRKMKEEADNQLSQFRLA
jgi:hypothetical protein